MQPRLDYAIRLGNGYKVAEQLRHVHRQQSLTLVALAISQLARFFRLIDAPHIVDCDECEDPGRVVFESKNPKTAGSSTARCATKR